MRRRFIAAFVGTLALDVVGAAPALAAEGQAPPTAAYEQAPAPAVAVEQAPAPAAAASPTPEWVRAHDAARRHLEQGEFTTARREFQALAATATREQDRAVVLELESVARMLEERGVHFTPPPGETTTFAHGPRERTTDELATLYISSIAYGLGTGAWLAFQTEPKSVAPAVLPALGLGGLAAGAVALADARGALKYGTPQAITTGLELGVSEGAVWALYNQAHVSYDSEWKKGTVATVVWTGATVGGVAGGVVGALAGTTPGRTSLVGSGGLWTAAVASLLTAGLSANDHGQRDDNALLAAGLGVNAGAIGSALLAGPMSPSVARVRFMDLGAIAGGAVAAGIYASASNGFRGNDRDDVLRGFFATTGIGVAAGFAAATLLTRGMTPDRGESPEKSGTARRYEALDVHVEPSMLAANGGAMLGATGTF